MTKTGFFITKRNIYRFDTNLVQFLPSNHPKIYYFFTKNDTFQVDFRSENVIHLNHGVTFIDSLIQDQKIYILDNYNLNLIDIRNLKKESVRHDFVSPYLNINNKEVIVNSSYSEFIFFNKNNLFHNNRIDYDIPNFVAFTTLSDEYHFATKIGVHSFVNGKYSFLKSFKSEKKPLKSNMDLKHIKKAYKLYRRRVKRKYENEVITPRYFNKMRFEDEILNEKIEPVVMEKFKFPEDRGGF